MKRRINKIISFSIVFSILMSQTGVHVFANALNEENDSAITNTPQTITNGATDDYIVIEGKKYTADEFGAYLSQFDPEDYKISRDPQALSAFGVVAIYTIPGVGQTVLLATGAIVLGVAVYHVGDYIYHQAVDWIYNDATAYSKKDADKAADDISDKVKLDDKHVDLEDFVDKKGKTPKDKSSGEFKSRTNKRYTIEKDPAGHLGYDGTTKKWKILKDGQRVGSLNGEGKIIGD